MGLLANKLSKKTLSEEDRNKLVQTVVSRLLSLSQPEKIFLFGSTVSNQMTEASDHDFAILFKTKEDLKAQSKKILRAKLFPDIFIDLLFFHEEDFEKMSQIGGVCWEILNKGVLIYDKVTKI